MASLDSSLQEDKLAPAEGAAQQLVDVGVSQAEAYQRGLTDINFFASLALPTVFIYQLPYFYIVCWQIITSRKEVDYGKLLRFALGLPRGHAKTTFIKIIIAWLIVYDKVRFALIVCATEPLAVQLLADIDDILASPNIEAVYGKWAQNLSTDTKELKKALYHGHPVILAAKGAGSSLRGLNIKHTRPDLIFCDDAQTRENDASPSESTALLDWIVATLFKVIAPRIAGNRLIIYVGNMYSDNCILKKLQDNPGWVSLVTGAILETGQPLWPELHSLDELMETFYHDESLGKADLWFAEVMNDPKSAATSLLHDALPDCPHDILSIQPDGVFLTIDPAGFRDTSDDNVISVHLIYDGKGIVAERIKGILDPEELIKAALTLALNWGASLIAIEAVAYQQTLKFWMDKYIVALGITGINVVEVAPHGRSKEARIRLFIQELYAQNYYLASGDTRSDFVWQAQKYKLGKKDNKDDLLDADAYGLDVRNEYWHLITNLKLQHNKFPTARVVGNNTPF